MTRAASADGVLGLVQGFFTIFDIREHGNHLVSFEMRDAQLGVSCTYRCFLPCGEPRELGIEAEELVFDFEIRTGKDSGEVCEFVETICIDGATYRRQSHRGGVPHYADARHSTFEAERELLGRLLDRKDCESWRIEMTSRQTGWRCSELVVTRVDDCSNVDPISQDPERVNKSGFTTGFSSSPTVGDVVSDLVVHAGMADAQLAPYDLLARRTMKRRAAQQGWG